MIRRQILAATSALVLVASLPACSQQGTVRTFDVTTFDAYAEAGLSFIRYVVGFPGFAERFPVQYAKIVADLAKAQALVATLESSSGGALTRDTALPIAQQLEQIVQDVITVGGPVLEVIVPGASAYIATAQQLLPLIEGLFAAEAGGVTMTAPTPTTKPDANKVLATLARGVS